MIVVGGGSGGHITPAVSVVRKLLELKPRTKIEFWTDAKYYKNVVKITTEIGVRWGDESRAGSEKQAYIRVRKLSAGKFRRYAGWRLKDYFSNLGFVFRDLVLGNLWGFGGFILGIIQSFFRLLPKNKRPDVIFLKGGFVGLPIGLVARIFKIPYVVHESDAVPGLANKILMKKAKIVAMGVPFEAEEAKENWRFVGIPVAPEFKGMSELKQKKLKRDFGFDPDKPLVVITGGSQGAKHLNETIRKILPDLLDKTSVGLVAGRSRYEEMIDLKKYEIWEEAELKSNFRMWSFSSVMDELMGAADIVVSRAGATTIAELASLEKAVILVPFERLPGGHQVKNAERLLELNAVCVVNDEDMVRDEGRELLKLLRKLINKRELREELGQKLKATANRESAMDLAKILVEVGKDKK